MFHTDYDDPWKRAKELALEFKQRFTLHLLQAILVLPEHLSFLHILLTLSTEGKWSTLSYLSVCVGIALRWRDGFLFGVAWDVLSFWLSFLLATDQRKLAIWILHISIFWTLVFAGIWHLFCSNSSCLAMPCHLINLISPCHHHYPTSSQAMMELGLSPSNVDFSNHEVNEATVLKKICIQMYFKLTMKSSEWQAVHCQVMAMKSNEWHKKQFFFIYFMTVKYLQPARWFI